VHNESESTVSLLPTAVDMVDCVDVQITAGHGESLTSAADPFTVHHHLSSKMTAASLLLVFSYLFMTNLSHLKQSTHVEQK